MRLSRLGFGRDNQTQLVFAALQREFVGSRNIEEWRNVKCFVRAVLVARGFGRRGNIGMGFAKRVVDLVEDAPEDAIGAVSEP